VGHGVLPSGDGARDIVSHETLDVDYKKLGILVQTPVPDEAMARLSPPLAPKEARDLYLAFLGDLFVRISRLKKVSLTVFCSDPNAATLAGIIPPRASIAAQRGASVGERLENVFGGLLDRDGVPACVIGSCSPDIPLAYIKRAFAKLKHKDVVLGPALGGGFYLLGLRRPAPEILRGIDRNDAGALRALLGRIDERGLSLGVVPPWYEVGDTEELSLLETLIAARAIEGRETLPRVARVLLGLRGSGGGG
jgi:glycosyltransferase A (GT-A) superfamily protein (DUF2064 family)